MDGANGRHVVVGGGGGGGRTLSPAYEMIMDFILLNSVDVNGVWRVFLDTFHPF